MPKLAEVWGLFAWIAGVCVLAGAASVYQKAKHQRVSLFEAIGELFFSGFVGLMTFLLFIGLGLTAVPPQDFARACLVAFSCGIAAHSSSRVVALWDKAVEQRGAKMLGVDASAATAGERPQTSKLEGEQ